MAPCTDIRCQESEREKEREREKLGICQRSDELICRWVLDCCAGDLQVATEVQTPCNVSRLPVEYDGSRPARRFSAYSTNSMLQHSSMKASSAATPALSLSGVSLKATHTAEEPHTLGDGKSMAATL
ncbi:unnamed protein product [Pleuronectes platessa]|uniref:Uncharacterized protein n=1 Tax=Pleuronectes platessa TaxID=8262 RepID=A0A9N7UYP5_PLEPL|nr:unnamed protein product [Pleuronectes platessa]